MKLDRKTGSLVGVVVFVLLIGGIFAFRDTGSESSSSETVKSLENGDANLAMDYTEIMFAQRMIPHHEQAVYMSVLALKNSTNQDVLDLATGIKAAQGPEIAQMKSWLERVDAASSMDHDMGMDGMQSESDLAALEAATGNTFDKLFLKGMIAHHEGAIAMATTIVDSKNSEIETLRDNIVEGQTAEISKMKALLKTL